MIIEIYQIIAVLLGIIAITLSILRFRDGKMSLGMLVVWFLIWIIVIFIALFPNTTNYLAIITGIGRGLDFALILGLLLSFYLIFKMYNKIENIEEELTDLVRELALQRRNMGLEEDDKIKSKSENEDLADDD
ncbi:MAG: DUF2304 family protein [Methanobacterium sp.]